MHRLLRSIARDDRAQDGFEYLLAAGVLALTVAVGLLAFEQLIPDFVSNSCSSVNTAAADPDDCIVETP